MSNNSLVKQNMSFISLFVLIINFKEIQNQDIIRLFY